MIQHMGVSMRVIRLIGLLATLLLVAAACGQKPGVNLQAGGGGGGGDIAAGGEGATGDGSTDGALGGTDGAGGTDAGGTGDAGGTDGATGGTGATGGGDSGGGGGGGTSGGGGGGGGTASAAGPNDKVGVSDKEIVIGLHAPVTGAAPFPQATFEKGLNVYWNFIKAKGGIEGRNVRVVFRDDQFNPSRAVQVCREMVEKVKVFLLVGGGGADQITACAKYANQLGVPYLSAGVNEVGLAELKTYFAMSQTYSQQSPTLASYMAKNLKAKNIAILVTDTPSFSDAQSSFTKAAQAAGMTIKVNEKIPKTASEAETQALAQKLVGLDSTYILTTPVTYIKLANQAVTQGYQGTFVGPGITAGLNAVTEAGCPAVGKGKFLSPFPQLDVIDQMDPNYTREYRRQNTGARDAPDDIGIALWGLSKGLHSAFTATGKDLGRGKFMAALRSGKKFETGVFPPFQFASGKNFGGQSMHLLEADCTPNVRKYKTTARFVTGF